MHQTLPYSYSSILIVFNCDELHLACTHSTWGAKLRRAKVKASVAPGTHCVTLLERRSCSSAAALWARPRTPTALCWMTCPPSSASTSVTWIWVSSLSQTVALEWIMIAFPSAQHQSGITVEFKTRDEWKRAWTSLVMCLILVRSMQV